MPVRFRSEPAFNKKRGCTWRLSWLAVRDAFRSFIARLSGSIHSRLEFGGSRGRETETGERHHSRCLSAT